MTPEQVSIIRTAIIGSCDTTEAERVLLQAFEELVAAPDLLRDQIGQRDAAVEDLRLRIASIYELAKLGAGTSQFTHARAALEEILKACTR